MEIEKLKKRTEKFNEALQLYFGGYATYKGYNAEAWFVARDFVLTNKLLIPRF